jgi:hypothetical protein
MYITRDLEGQIIKYLKQPEIIAVVGPRQSLISERNIMLIEQSSFLKIYRFMTKKER